MYTKLKLCHISGKIWVIFISFSISVFSDIELSVHVLGKLYFNKSRYAMLIFCVLWSYTTFLLMQHSKPELPLRTAKHPRGGSKYTNSPLQASDVSTVFLKCEIPIRPHTAA